ncbi:hypothetical protein MNB_SM-4-1449 [hydrothermal vent metagenome]|uniref:Uncharacterized protein n=1 Tax=hydrothermal vent metagenome TaxID=652676 RepID=A0A1W1BEU3_9ZZZZ
MQVFVRFLMVTVLLFSTLSATEFADMYEISVKKDESTKFLVKYNNYIREFKFRWTLYVNDGLVMFHSYDAKLAQNILYLNTTNQSFKVFLKPQSNGVYEAPYLLVKFKKFNFEKNRAKFEVFLSDKKSLIKLEKIKKKS